MENASIKAESFEQPTLEQKTSVATLTQLRIEEQLNGQEMSPLKCLLEDLLAHGVKLDLTGSWATSGFMTELEYANFQKGNPDFDLAASINFSKALARNIRNAQDLFQLISDRTRLIAEVFGQPVEMQIFPICADGSSMFPLFGQKPLEQMVPFVLEVKMGEAKFSFALTPKLSNEKTEIDIYSGRKDIGRRPANPRTTAGGENQISLHFKQGKIIAQQESLDTMFWDSVIIHDDRLKIALQPLHDPQLILINRSLMYCLSKQPKFVVITEELLAQLLETTPPGGERIVYNLNDGTIVFIPESLAHIRLKNVVEINELYYQINILRAFRFQHESDRLNNLVASTYLQKVRTFWEHIEIEKAGIFSQIKEMFMAEPFPLDQLGLLVDLYENIFYEIRIDVDQPTYKLPAGRALYRFGLSLKLPHWWPKMFSNYERNKWIAGGIWVGGFFYSAVTFQTYERFVGQMFAVKGIALLPIFSLFLAQRLSKLVVEETGKRMTATVDTAKLNNI